LSSYIKSHKFHTYSNNSLSYYYNYLLYNFINIFKIIIIIIILTFLSLIFSSDDINIELLKQDIDKNIFELSNIKYTNFSCKATNQFINYEKLFNNKNKFECSFDKSFKTNNSNILNEVTSLHLNNANEEISDLKDEISILKTELLNKELNLLQTENSINDTLKFMDNMNNTIDKINHNNIHRHFKSI